MKPYLLAGLCLVAVLLQISFLPALRPFGIVPNLILVVVAGLSFGGSVVRAMVAAIVTGFTLDLASGSDFGLKTVLLVLTVLVAAFIRRSGFELSYELESIAVVVAVTLLAGVLAILEIGIAGGRLNGFAAGTRLGMEVAVNAVLMAVLAPVIRWLNTTSAGSEMLR